jgi:hypothetical protein
MHKNVLTPKQFAAFTQRRRAEIRPAYIYIPRNEHGIRSGYYRDVDITRLLRENRGKAKVILYIARQVGQG